MRTQHYDAVFLGTRTPTLLTAAYLARNGLRVLVLGQGTSEPTSKVGEVELPRNPTIRLALGSPATRHLLDAIGVTPSLKRRASIAPIAIPLRLPSRSLDLERDEALRARTIAREFPEARRAMAAFERRCRLAREAFDAYVDHGGTLQGRGFRATRALRKLERDAVFGGDPLHFDPADELRREPLLVEALELVAAFHSGRVPPASGFGLALAYERALEGAIRIEGGEGWLRRTIVDRIEAYGGDVRPRISADRILLEGKAVSGLRLRTSHEEIGASAVISGIPAGRLLEILPEPVEDSPTAALLRAPRPAFARHLLHVAIAQEGVPRGLEAELFLLPPGSRRALLGLHLTRTAESGGLVWFTVESLVPIADDDPAELRARVLGALREVFHFADEHLRYVHSPNDAHGVTDARTGEVVWSADPSVELSPMETLDDLPRRGAAGLLGLPTELPVDGLLLANGQCLPELGVEGELLAGLEASRRLLEKSGTARFSRLAPFRSRRW